MLLWATQIILFVAALAGLAHLWSADERALKAAKGLALAAVAVQLAWLVAFGVRNHYCVLLDPWGVMAVLTIGGVIAAWHLSSKYGAVRLFIGFIVLMVVAVIAGRMFLPAPGVKPVAMGWVLAFHILMIVLGIALLGLGFVSGAMMLARGRILKSSGWISRVEVRWPALVTLDRLFVNSHKWGILLLATGIIMGIASFSEITSGGPWYGDLKVWFTLVGFGIYAALLQLRARRDFSTKPMVGLSALAFACILFGLFGSALIRHGFHTF